MTETEAVPSDDVFVFNLVWTGSVFTYLRYFVASQLDHSGARFRFLSNGCPPEQIAMMERFAARHPTRVVEILETSPTMETHGASLDKVFNERDDGDFFCFLDQDILVSGPFIREFSEELASGAAGVTSGRGVWVEDDRVPPGHLGVAGEHFYSQEGYLFGSPHFAMYRRDPLAATMNRWGVGFGSTGRKLSEPAKARLEESGLLYWVYDTAKLVNIFLQADGNRLSHFEHPSLLHVGGVPTYLGPTKLQGREGGLLDPNWQNWRGMETRFEVARFTARVLRALVDQQTPPEIPDGVEPAVRARLVPVRDALIDVVGRYEDSVNAAGATEQAPVARTCQG